MITAVCGVFTAAISAWAAWKASEAKQAGKAATKASEANGNAITHVQQSADIAAVKAEAAVEKAQEAVTATVAGNEQVAAVHTLVNGQREAMAARIADLEAENRKLRGN